MAYDCGGDGSQETPDPQNLTREAAVLRWDGGLEFGLWRLKRGGLKLWAGEDGEEQSRRKAKLFLGMETSGSKPRMKDRRNLVLGLSFGHEPASISYRQSSFMLTISTQFIYRPDRSFFQRIFPITPLPLLPSFPSSLRATSQTYHLIISTKPGSKKQRPIPFDLPLSAPSAPSSCPSSVLFLRT